MLFFYKILKKIGKKKLITNFKCVCEKKFEMNNDIVIVESHRCQVTSKSRPTDGRHLPAT